MSTNLNSIHFESDDICAENINIDEALRIKTAQYSGNTDSMNSSIGMCLLLLGLLIMVVALVAAIR